MKSHLVFAAAAALILMGSSCAGPPKTGNNSKTAGMDFNPQTGAWEIVPPERVIANELSTPGRRNAQRVAMQPIRFLVMAAKAPCMLAGYPLLALGCAANNQEIPGPGPMFENFDPGLAIDADLEGTAPRMAPKDERAPAPFKSDLRISGSPTSSKVRPNTTRDVASSR